MARGTGRRSKLEFQRFCKLCENYSESAAAEEGGKGNPLGCLDKDDGECAVASGSDGPALRSRKE